MRLYRTDGAVDFFMNNHQILQQPKEVTGTNPALQGYHYQIECKTRMTIETMKGYLNNMARAAIVRQCELAKSTVV